MFNIAWFWMNFSFVIPFLFGVQFVLSRITKKKHFWIKTICTLLIMWGWTIVWTIITKSVPDNVAGNMFFTHITFFVQIFLILAYIPFSYHTNIWGAIFGTTVSYSLQHFSQRLHIILLNLIKLVSKNGGLAFDSWQSILIWIIIAGLCYFLWYFFLFRRLNPDSFGKIDTMKGQICISVIVVVASIFVNSGIALASNNDVVVSTLGYLLSIIISFLVILLDYAMVIEEKQKNENEKLNILLKEGKKDYEASKDSIDILNVKLHDIKHLLQTLNSSTSEETVKNIKESLTEFEQKYKTGNDAIDVIVNKKESECVSNGIDFTCFLDATGLEYISPYELYTLFDNAIGNAIEAAKNCDQDRKVISIHGKRKIEKIRITFTNYIPKGVTIKLVKGLPQTNKDKKYHGFGMRSMQMLAEKHNGKIKCEIYEDIYNLHVTLPIKKD